MLLVGRQHLSMYLGSAPAEYIGGYSREPSQSCLIIDFLCRMVWQVTLAGVLKRSAKTEWFWPAYRARWILF